MSKVTLNTRVRLPDNTVCTISEGLKNLCLVRTPYFIVQHDENGGNIIGLPKRYKDIYGFDDEQSARDRLKGYRNSRIVRQVEVRCASDSHKVYGHLSRAALK